MMIHVDFKLHLTVVINSLYAFIVPDFMFQLHFRASEEC